MSLDEEMSKPASVHEDEVDYMPGPGVSHFQMEVPPALPDPKDLQLNFESNTTDSPKKRNFTTIVRYIMFLFFGFYMVFAFLILFTGNIDLKHKQKFLTEIVQMEVKEITIQGMFVANAMCLTICALVGIYSFFYHRYRLFIWFFVLFLFTFVFSIVTIKVSMTAYNKMGNALDHKMNFAKMWTTKMNNYNWHAILNKTSIYVNKFQNEFQCCGGLKGYHDWEDLKPSTVPYGAFPLSCCRLHFNKNMQIPWCGYAQVELRPGCPTAFKHQLVHIYNSFYDMNMLLVESAITQFLSLLIFIYLIVLGQRWY